MAISAVVLFATGGILGNPWFRFVTIEGGSMQPAISRGDLIVVVPAPATIKPGMIVVLAVDGGLVTHRVVGLNSDGTLVTRGDANGVNDAWGARQVRVVGLYAATVPWLGQILTIDPSSATFADGVAAAMHITVGPWLPVAAPAGAAPAQATAPPTVGPSAEPSPAAVPPTLAPSSEPSPDPAPSSALPSPVASDEPSSSP
ncbi:MAG TPA: signal peptidase I [Candidatus Binatus sp.]|nr:signal peptidase I [Candidatus Binatus sp.]